MSNPLQHRTVLLNEAVDALAIAGSRRDGIFVDGTFGRGGHSAAILARLGTAGRLLAFDRDPDAVASARSQAAFAHPRFFIVHERFTSLADELARAEIELAKDEEKTAGL